MDFKNTKVRIKNERESEAVQRKFFELGFAWYNGQDIHNTNKGYMYVSENGRMDWGNTEEFFRKQSSRESTVEQILTGKIPKPQKITHIVTWDEQSIDPIKFFAKPEEAKKFIRDLDKRNATNIKLIEVKSIKEIKVNRVLAYKEYKM